MSRSRFNIDQEDTGRCPDGAPAGAREPRGFALMLTLWILAVLSLLLLTFSMQVRTEARASNYLRSHLDASYLAQGAVRRVAVELIPRQTEDSSGDLEAIRGERLGIWLVDPADWSVAQTDPEGPTRPVDSERYVVCEIRAEDAKLSLNRADRGALTRLGVSPVVADAIESFRMARALERSPEEPTGTQDTGEQEPEDREDREQRDESVFVTVEDLLLVPGIENFRGDETQPGLADLLTTFSGGKVYVNDASLAVIGAIPGVDDYAARAIRARIDSGQPFDKVEQVANVPGVTSEMMESLLDWVTVEPRYYRIQAVALSRGVRREAHGVVAVDESSVQFVYLKAGAP